MINTPSRAIEEALATRTNAVGMCQKVTREWFNAPSVGDVDRDGASDAEDGWKAEPVSARHPGDRNPPPGMPLSFGGGSKDNGHRAISLPGGRVRTIDFNSLTQRYAAGVTGTAESIANVEKALGVTYLGWSETISGIRIPKDPPPPAPKDPYAKAIKQAAKQGLEKNPGPVKKRRLKEILETAKKILRKKS